MCNSRETEKRLYKSHGDILGLNIRRWRRRLSLPMLAVAALLLALMLLIASEGWQASRARYAAFLVRQLQTDQRAFADYLKRSHIQHGHKAGPGIVICAGGTQLLVNAYISIKVLRGSLKCDMPIEIYHVGPDDVGPVMRKILEEISGVSLIDLMQAELPIGHRPPRVWKSYMWKIFALYLTEFTQVLLLDADSQPLRDPTELFNSLQYRETGNLFWPDFWGAATTEAPKKDVYKWLGLSVPWEEHSGWRCAESGQVLLDKRRHGDVVEWLWFLNSHAELLYKHMLGDKDTFEMAFMLANKHHLYQQILVSPGMPLSAPKSPVWHQKWIVQQFKFEHEKTRYLRLGMLQYGPDYLPAFLHRTERTKFANYKNGYDLKTMEPAYFLPSYGPNVTAWEKSLIWNAHSFPQGMVDIGGQECLLSEGQKHILKALNQGVEIGAVSDGDGCWYSRGQVPQQAIFKADLLGEIAMLSIWESIQAYKVLEKVLKYSIRLKRSP